MVGFLHPQVDGSPFHGSGTSDLVKILWGWNVPLVAQKDHCYLVDLPLWQFEHSYGQCMKMVYA